MKHSISLIPFSIFLFLLTPSALAQEADYSCYLQNSNNRIVDLSKLCGQPTAPSPSDSFVANYQQLAGQYSPPVRQALNQYIAQNRASAIAAAKATCRVLKFSGSAAADRQRALLSYDSSPDTQAKHQITASLAVTHFCPELNGR
ncbi:MAG: hypothetical protein HC780_29995 [Leptolyngbyaceae cyanobacterium CSU_1_3]|nr:hypothetical protein [Leptolyngbyaceae cyanobacterium CSU_1_3]